MSSLLASLLIAAQLSAPLPPLIPWNGKSRELVAGANDPWITPSEKSGLTTTPSYDETVAWLRRLVAASPNLSLVSLGKSGEGRDLWMVIASRERATTPEELRRVGKPTLLAQGGIHSGEIDGKDAGLMLLRDMTVGRAGVRPLSSLLDRANFLFVPIFNVDGHERASRFARINQRGPEVMGWRTTARNLNLNRDYTKVDSPEMRAMVTAIDRWKPDLYLDLHVTDGADYQYDITFGWNETTGYSPEIVRWLEGKLQPALTRDLRAMGHIPGPLVFPIAGDDVSKGISLGNAPPRLSTGYGDIRRLPTVLVENHSLKPYDQRVLGTRVLLETVLALLGRDAATLRRAVTTDAGKRLDPVPLDWQTARNAEPQTIELAGVESRTRLSPISGTVWREWLGRPVTMRVPVFRETEVAASVPRAKAYWIPPAWSDIAERLRLHGVAVERTTAPREIEVEMYRLVDPTLASQAFEGRVGLETKTAIEKRKERFPAGSFRISTDQPLGDLAAVLLEPASADSFLRWGFFHEILQRTEYVEDYVLEPLAEQMLANDPKLAAEFQRRLVEDPDFRARADRRLQFFYERTPYYDERWRLYPVAREP